MKNLFLGIIVLFSITAKAADFTIELVPATGSVQFSDIANKPSTFAPSAHVHAITEVTGLQTTLGTKANSTDLLDYKKSVDFKSPTIQKLTSGSSYSPPVGAKWLRVRMIGGGAGGHGGNGAAGSGSLGTNGSASTFGTSLLTANGGLIANSANFVGGPGGTASIALPAIGIAIQGGTGASGVATGGGGAASPFGAGGPGGYTGISGGSSPVANTGAGGGGGGNGGGHNAGAGGGAGGYVDAIIPAPLAASYAYAIGGFGIGGSAPAGGPGGNGAAGVIIVEEHYQ